MALGANDTALDTNDPVIQAIEANPAVQANELGNLDARVAVDGCGHPFDASSGDQAMAST
jgi:hypothetical protein